MIRISKKESKDKAIDIITAICDAFLFPFVSDANKNNLVTHMEWMKRQAGPLDIRCQLETDPTSKQTRITIDAFSQE